MMATGLETSSVKARESRLLRLMFSCGNVELRQPGQPALPRWQCAEDRCQAIS